MHQKEYRDVEQSLARLGIEEIEERMEISPLLGPGDPTQDIDRDPFLCCSCKLPEPNNPTPMPPEDPTGGI